MTITLHKMSADEIKAASPPDTSPVITINKDYHSPDEDLLFSFDNQDYQMGIEKQKGDTMPTSKRVTIDQLTEAYRSIITAKKDLKDAKFYVDANQRAFDALTKRASKDVLAQFLREGNLFS